MSKNVAQKLIASHLIEGNMRPGEEIGLKIDQTLTQDATGTLVMLEFEALGITRVRTELSAQYVDHNLLQEDFKNPDDHLFTQCLQEVRSLVQPSRQWGEPSRAYGTLWCAGKNLVGFGQPYLCSRLVGDVGDRSWWLGGGNGNGRRALSRRDAKNMGS